MVTKYNHPVKTARDGDYWRLLKPGSYLVTVHAPGYAPSTKTVVVPQGDAAARYNFVLEPSADAGTEFSSEVKTSEKKPVPVSLIIGLTVICAISLALATALVVMVVKKYRHSTDNVESGYVAVQSQSD